MTEILFKLFKFYSYINVSQLELICRLSNYMLKLHVFNLINI